MGFSGSLPLYVVHRCYIYLCLLIGRIKMLACLYCSRPTSHSRRSGMDHTVMLSNIINSLLPENCKHKEPNKINTVPSGAGWSNRILYKPLKTKILPSEGRSTTASTRSTSSGTPNQNSLSGAAGRTTSEPWVWSRDPSCQYHWRTSHNQSHLYDKSLSYLLTYLLTYLLIYKLGPFTNCFKVPCRNLVWTFSWWQ